MPAPSFTLGWVRNLHTAPPSTDAGRVIAIAAAFSAISILSIAIRLWQRCAVLKLVGLDDIAASFSMVLGLAYSLNAIFQTRWGLGLNASDFPIVNAVPFSRIQYIGGPLYCMAILGFKVSLIASYLRLAGFNKTYRYILYVVMALVVANQIIYTFLLTFACHPIAKQWDGTLDGACINSLATYFGLGGSSLGFDILIILLPFPILKRLHLDLRRKMALGCLFALGFFVSIIQIIRIRTIAKLVNYTDSQPIIIWSMVEINLGVFIACVPSFAPLLRQFGQKVSHGYQTNSQSRRQKATIGAPAESSHTALGGKPSKGNTLVKTRTTDDEDMADDEVKLWSAPRRGWPSEAYAWGGDAHPLSDLQPSHQLGQGGDMARTSQRHISNQASGEQRDGEITVVHEISVQSHNQQH